MLLTISKLNRNKLHGFLQTAGTNAENDMDCAILSVLLFFLARGKTGSIKCVRDSFLSFTFQENLYLIFKSARVHFWAGESFKLVKKYEKDEDLFILSFAFALDLVCREEASENSFEFLQKTFPEQITLFMKERHV